MKKTTLFFAFFIVISCMSGCSFEKSPDLTPPFSTKTVTQDCRDSYATFIFDLPNDWITHPQDFFHIICAPEEAIEMTFDSDVNILPFKVEIYRYRYPYSESKETKKMYDELFSGNPELYEQNFLDASYDETFLKYFFPDYTDFLDEISIDKFDPVFEYFHYNGISEKITEVRYTINNTFEDTEKRITYVDCYLEDSSYKVTGVLDDSMELSSGEVAPWVARTIKIDEHYSFTKDGIKKND